MHFTAPMSEDGVSMCDRSSVSCLTYLMMVYLTILTCAISAQRGEAVQVLNTKIWPIQCFQPLSNEVCHRNFNT